MKKALSVILCAVLCLSLCILASCGEEEGKQGQSVELKFISEPATGYAWRVVVSREGIVEVSETFEEDEDDKDNPKAGWQIYTVKAVGAGEVALDFAYVVPGSEEVKYAATYVYVVDEELKMTEKLREGTYFELDNVVVQNTYVIRLDVDASGKQWQYSYDPDGIIEVSHTYEEEPYALETDAKQGQQVFTVMGMKTGNVTISFTYADENGENAVNDAAYELSVDDNLYVTEIKHSGTYFNED